MEERSGLAELLALWDQREGAISYTELRARVSALDLNAADLAQWIIFEERCYCRVAIHRRPHYEVLVLCWQSGQVSAIHDHEGSSCVVRVVAGCATETRYCQSPCGRLVPRRSRDHGPGRVLGCRGDGIHQMGNLASTGEDLVTLHVYSPPPGSWNFYALADTTLAGHDRLIRIGPRTIVADPGGVALRPNLLGATRRVMQ